MPSFGDKVKRESDPLQLILSRLQNVKECTSGWSARCAGHDDSHNSLSVGVGEDGRVLLHCFAGCPVEKIVAALGLGMRDLFPVDRVRGKGMKVQKRPPITIDDLARDKGLPVEFLAKLGLRDCPQGVQVTYLLRGGTAAPRQRIRTALVAKEGSLWTRGQGAIVPYGLERLEDARKVGFIVLVEGESDRWTLCYHGFPCLGIPGADMTGKLGSDHLTGISKIYVIREPDKGGATFIAGVAERLREIGWKGDARRVVLPDAKDPNDLHKQNPDGFKQAFQHALDEAETLSQAQANSEGSERKAQITRPNRSRKRQGAEPEPLALDHLELPDGRKTEILSHDNKVVFGIFEPGGRSIELEDHIETGGQLYLPRRGSLVQQGAIILPPPPDFSRGEDPELFDDLCAFVCRYWVGPANWIRMTVLYVLLTWIIHALDEVAYLRMLGDLGSAKSRFCDVVHVLCFRGIRTAGNISAGVLPRVLTLFPDATLIVDEADLHGENAQEVRLILRSGSSRRTPILKCGVPARGKDWEPVSFSAFGPKVIAGRKTTRDDALETRCISQSVAKASSLGEVPISLPPQFGQEAQTLRARLMAFRIINYGCAKEFQETIQATGKQLVAEECDFRTAQLGAPLLALADLLDHELARESCLRVLRHYDTCVGLERGQGLDGLLARFVENLRAEGCSSLELGVFRGALATFAQEEGEFDPAFIPKKQALSRRLNTYAHALRIRLMERTSGHADRVVAILPDRADGQPQDSAPIASVPISPDDSMGGTEDDLLEGDN